MTTWLALFCSHAHAGVVINEFLPNPDGADGGFEWVELYNNGTNAVDLNGWTLEKATSSFTAAHTLGAIQIPAGGYVLIGEANVAGVTEVATLSLGNAGSSGDALRLVDATTAVVDTVVYGGDNSDGFLDDSGAIAVSLAPVASGVSTARVPNGVDTNNGSDFILLASPSPGSDNSAAVPTCDGAAQSGISINELMPDPAGADADMEWVELYNSGSSSVDLSGWAIAAGTSSYNTQGTLPAGTSIDPGAFLVVTQSALGPAGVVAAGFTLGNASNADSVQVRDCLGGVADTVVYGTDNSDGWLDDLGGFASLAPKPGSGQTVGRSDDGVDSNDNAADFVVMPTPSPGASNTGGVGPISCAPGPGSRVVINELMPDPPGADAGNEWVEIYNASGGPVDISGWGLSAGTATFSVMGNLGANLVLGAGEFLVIDGTNLTAVRSYSLGNAGSNADGVQLVDCGGVPADTVIYGTDNSDGWLDDDGNLASLAPKPGSGEVIARLPDGIDTNNSAGDFAITPPTRGFSNTAAPPDCGGFGAGLVVNEFLTNPVGADDQAEWVELFHAGSAPIDLDGWALEAAGSDNWSAKVVFGPGEVINPGQFLLIGGDLVPGATHPLTGIVGNGTNGDGLRVVDCSGFISDVVVYGRNNDDMVPDETGQPANSVAPTPPKGGSVQRVVDGYDTGTNNLDFSVSEQPTPGQPNLMITPIVCVPSAGGVVINEMVADPDGADDGLEWIELYNGGSAAQPLDGWAFSAGTADYDNKNIQIPGGISIGPGAFLVIGGELVPEVDVTIDFTLGNGLTSRDGLRLFDCEGAALDTLVYGKVDEEEPDPGIVDDNGELAGSYGDPSGIQSLFRMADGVDNNTAEDWQVGRATPGASNVFEAPPPVDGGRKGCGGGGGPPAGDAPDGAPSGDAPQSTGCSAIPTHSLALFLALSIAFRRRRLPVT